MFSSTRATRRVPGMGAMSVPRVRSQARAVCAGVAPFSAPIARTSSTMARLRVKFSPVNRGFVLRQSSSAKSSRVRICPVSRPWPSGEYGTSPMPSSRSSGRISSSTSRVHKRVLGLQRRHGLHRVRAPDGRPVRPRTARSGGTLPCGDQLSDSSSGVLDRGVRVDAVLVVEVDVGRCPAGAATPRPRS